MEKAEFRGTVIREGARNMAPLKPHNTDKRGNQWHSNT
jgi:hypothetical protein